MYLLYCNKLKIQIPIWLNLNERLRLTEKIQNINTKTKFNVQKLSEK